MQSFVIDVSIYGAERFKIRQRIGQRSITDIAGVPDFIAVLEMLKDFRIKVAVRVGNDAYFQCVSLRFKSRVLERSTPESECQILNVVVHTNIVYFAPMAKSESKYCGCLFFSANALARNLTRIAEEEYKVIGLSPSHALLLLTINEHQGIQPKELAMEMQLTPSTVTRLLDKLESKKYIVREEEGKKVKVFSTIKGRSLNQKIKNAWLRLYNRYIGVTGLDEGKKMTHWIYETAQKLN